MASSTTKLVSRTRLSSLASRFTSASSFTSHSSPLIRPPFPAPQPRFPLSRSPVELSRLGSIRPYSAVSVKQVVRAFKLEISAFSSDNVLRLSRLADFILMEGTHCITVVLLPWLQINNLRSEGEVYRKLVT
ncbi:hypothetical protein Tsubulata_026951 [Turnera subulata]|uniref:Uncharacterized protein n=1 Tax=Turnera subulata TaxID=218843 RepID=A0A9Q0F1F4_9ROSI|nr:hypothetical protein Tsubulata_026951 [Turnera subulata]